MWQQVFFLTILVGYHNLLVSGLIDFVPVPHFDTPSHPESRFMNDVVKYLGEHHVYYKTLKDGDVIVEDINDRGLCL